MNCIKLHEMILHLKLTWQILNFHIKLVECTFFRYSIFQLLLNYQKISSFLKIHAKLFIIEDLFFTQNGVSFPLLLNTRVLFRYNNFNCSVKIDMILRNDMIQKSTAWVNITFIQFSLMMRILVTFFKNNMF